MKRIVLIIATILSVSVPVLGQKNSAHIADYDTQARTGTEFAQSTNNIYFVNSANKVCSMHKKTLDAKVINDLNESEPPASTGTGLMWDNDRLYYNGQTGFSNFLYYIDWNSSTGWEVNGPFDIGNSTSKFAASTYHIYFVDGNSKVRACGKTNLSNSYIMHPSAPSAKSGTDLIWKNNKLYYIATDNKIYYLKWNYYYWSYYGPYGSAIHPDSDIEVSTNNIYYVDTSGRIRSMSLSTYGVSIISTINARPSSDLKWIDEKLFYISADGQGVSYLNWSLNSSWINEEMFSGFLTAKDKEINENNWNHIHSNSNFIGVNNEVYFVGENFNNINYFRAPLELEVITNSQTKTGWTLNQALSDEFDNLNGFSTGPLKWRKDYGYQNHPRENDGSSMYFNNVGTGNHSVLNVTIDSQTNSALALKSEKKTTYPFYFRSFCQPEDTNSPRYPYRSAAAISYELQEEGYFEIRCKFTETQWEKFCFWLHGSKVVGLDTTSYEIDLFEFEGSGLFMPTNYHYVTTGIKKTDDPYQIHVLKGQNLTDDFYTYAIEWNSDEIIYYINNQAVRTISHGLNYPEIEISDVPMIVHNTTRIWSYGDEYNEHNNYASVFPNNFLIDYVRVYSKTATKGAAVIDNEDINHAPGFEIYPNPSGNLINIVLPENSSESKISITNMDGKLVKQDIVRGSHVQYDLSSIVSGIYIIRVATNGGTAQKLHFKN